MSTSLIRSGSTRFGFLTRKAVAAFAAFVVSMTSLVVGAIPSPAAAAPGDADLAITKTANSGSALVGTAVEFTITVTNNGPGDTTGVVVSDVLPSEFSFSSYSATAGSYDQSSGRWSIGSMPVGSTRILSIVAVADSVAFVTNTAAISASAQVDPVSANNSAAAAVNIVTVPPAVCDTDDIIGISGSTIYSINTQTGVATPEFQTAFSTGNRNALASNSDLGLVYWGSGSVVYWWNPIDDTEGVLVDLTGQINGTLESAGATYHGGYYYFSAEVSGNANGIYRIAINPAGGTSVLAGSLEQLAPNEPEDSLEYLFNRDMRPDYGDLTVLTVNGEPVMFGSIVDGNDFSGTGYWWSYNINNGTLSYIAQENNPNHVQLGTDLNGDTWGTAANGDLYSVNVATGAWTFTGHAIGIGFYDLSGSFCVPPELADIDLGKAMIANADEDGSNTITPGDTLTYQFIATNTGNVVLTGVTITDPLPGMSSLSCTSPMPAGFSSGESLTCTATYQVTAADQFSGSILNTAAVTGIAPSGAGVSDTASSIVTVAQPDVTVTKSAGAIGPVVAGQVITYTVGIANTGGMPIDGISVVDPLPVGTSYVPESTLVTGWTGDAAAGSWSELFDPDITMSNNCSAPSTVTFDMAAAGTISDVELGFTASHNRRGEIRVTLSSPSGTVAVLMSGNSSDRDNNYDVLLDGDSTAPLDDDDSDDVTPADYERTVGAPALESFAGEPGAGTWTLAFCDTNPSSSGGTFRQATLFIDGVQETSAVQVKDNIPGGAEVDLVDGVPPTLVAETDNFDIPVGESMTITYQVQVDDALDGSVTEILNEATVFSTTLPATTGYVINLIDFQPVLEVVKDGPAGPVAVGDTVGYTYIVTHTSASDGSPVDVVLTDDIIDLSAVTPTGDDDGDGLLDGGETWLYTVDYVVPPGTPDPLVNVATVSGTDLDDEPITEATDDHAVDIDFQPLLTVTKVGVPDPASVGDDVVYTYTVYHDAASDGSPVGGVTVVDSRGLIITGPSGDTDGDDLLDGGEVWVYTAAETITGATPDPLTNDVAVDGTDADGEPIPLVTDSESVDIVWAPVIQVDKTGPVSATLAENVTYTFSVSHDVTSDGSPVGNVTVMDDVAGAAVYVSGDDGDNSLEDGETWVFTVDYTITLTDPDPLVNVATLSGDDQDGNAVVDTDSHSTDIDFAPVLTLDKSGPATAVLGETVTYTFSVSHDAASDGSPVANVTVTDDVAGAATYVSGDDGDGLLEVGETWIFEATYTITATDADPLVNTGTVSGDDEDGDPVTGTDTHTTDIINPAIAIAKTPDSQTILVGTAATFTITVSNTGDADLTNVVVSDVLAPDCGDTIGDLASGESTSYSCSLANVTSDFTNTASVAGSHAAGGTVTDSDTAAVTVIGPAISATKSPDSQMILTNGDATFTITVANTGDTLLTNVLVTDTLVPACGGPLGDLAPGDSVSYICDATNVTVDFTNTVSVVGSHGAGGTVSDSDTADVDVINPAVTIEKTPDTQQALAGDTVTFDITVANTGDVDLTDVGVSDAVAPNCDNTIGDLAAGASTNYSCTMVAGVVDFTNTAAATGDDPLGNSVTDSDTADVDVINPSITVAKTSDTQQALAGDTVIFDITVTNTGDVDLTDVTVTDALAPNCDNSFISLTLGASETFSCSMTAGAADFTNTADVSAVDPLGNPVTASDTADVDVIHPSITIEKAPDTRQAVAGETVTFDITVTNTGDVDLSNVAVTDALAPNCDNTIGGLGAGASAAYSCSMVAGAADFTNTADVAAIDPLGNPVTASDTADVDVISPAIDIAKNPPAQIILDGAAATFTITVTNIGDVDLADVVVTDVAAPDCDSTIGDLAAGAAFTYTCSLDNVIGDFTNIAVVIGEHAATGTPVTDSDAADVQVIAPQVDIEKTPNSQTVVTGSDVTFTITVANSGDSDLTSVVVTDLSVPACDATFASLPIGAVESYDCTIPTVAAGFTNTADVTANEPSGGTVSDTDSADVVVIDPGLAIEKTPDTQTILDGEDATFTITVTNTGDSVLSNVVVTDAQASACDRSIGGMAIGEVVSYDCTVTGVTAGFTNTADVSGTDELGNPLADTDTADVVVAQPAIEIVKTADAPVVISGADVTFTITVTNTGTTDLADVTVTDVLAPACDSVIGDLAAGAATSYRCTFAGATADFTNTAVVTATHPLGGTVTDQDTADVDVIGPEITITKTADAAQVLVGDDATFTITVENTGDVALTSVVVTDPLAADCANTVGDLSVGEVATYSCTVPNVAADFTNTAVGSGNDPLGNPVTDTDSADVDVIAPAISISKTPDSQFVVSGDDATFTITVENTGDVGLTGVAVADALVPACDATIGDLAVGATNSYTCDATAVIADFLNTASVVGTHPAGGTVTDSDTAAVSAINPAITLTKDPALQQLLSGQDAGFTITVTNTGDSPLTDVTITDTQAPGCDTVFPTLGAGVSETVNCSVTDVTSDFTNTAAVVATHAAGGTVTDSDTADVVVLVPQVDIQKTPDTQQVAPGSDVTFTITVTNSGVVPLSNVVVTDAQAPACDTTIATLAVGESTAYDCTVAGVTADFTNVAGVTASDAGGNQAGDSDDAVVDVVAPAVTIAKTPDTQAIGLNAVPTFTISVSNTGDIDLTNVVVTDALAPACDATFVSLPVGVTETYTCDGTATSGDFTNVADVTADSVIGPVSDSDTADVTVLVPGIDIQKTPDTQLVGPGGTATFTITVTNAGATPLTNIVVTDALAPACDATIAALAIGESTSYNCDLTGVTGDLTNTAEVTAEDGLGNPVSDSDTADVDFVDPAITVSKTPDLQTLLVGEDAAFTVTVTNTGDTDLANVVVSDPQVPDCAATFAGLAIGASETVTCTVTGVTGTFTNVASATADTPLGTQVSDSDDALVEIVNPGVDIAKTPDTQQIHIGEDATFTITVTNTGDQDLVNLSVTDIATPSCDATIASLAVGASTSYDCTAVGVTADFTNFASVSGSDVLGNPVSDSDDALVDVIAPAIEVQKTPDLQSVVVNGSATFTITVANTGDVDLTGVSLTDAQAPACDSSIGDLGVGATTSITCSVDNVATGFTNTAAATGLDPIGDPVSDSDTADVTVVTPAIDIQKTPDLQQARSGDTIDFTVTVTNTGATALSNVAVTDALAPACNNAIGDLAVGASTSYTCSMTAGAADFTNTADVTANDPIGNPVTDSDSADVDVIAPAISVRKSPDGQAVVVGGTATFTIEVANTGDVDLTEVAVSDALVPACDATFGALAAGATSSYTCTFDNVTADFTNTAVANGIDPIGAQVSDSDTAEVTILVPGLDIQKTPNLQTLVEGDDATFTIIVTNTGQTDLFGVTVTDALVPACDNTIGDLPVGSAPVIYTCTATVAGSFTNTANVAATDPLANPLSDSDTADVAVLLRGSINGTLAYDIAGDGVIDASDIGLDGVPVTAIWAGLDGVFGTVDDQVFTTVTNSNGGYSYADVPPGAYQVVVDITGLPAGIDFPTLDPDGTLDSATSLTLPENTTVSGVDFAYTATGSIGDQVFIDLDGNGVQDPGEPGLGGLDVTVTWRGPDGLAGGGDDYVFTTTTAADGTYLVDGLPDGEFSVVVDGVPVGLTGATSQTTTLAGSEERDDVDFPFVGAGSIGDQVFEDTNHNGVFDAGESGVPGVTVTATWAGVDGVVGTADDVTFTTVTDGNGRYLVDLLPAGGFIVELDDTTVPADLGSAPAVSLSLAAGESDLTADFPLVGNRPPVAVDDEDVTDEDTPVVIIVLDDDSDPDGHIFEITDTTDPLNGTIVVNADGTITYTPEPGFVGVDTFTYTICEVAGQVISGVPSTGLCDTATVTVTIIDVNQPPGPEASFQTVVVGDPLGTMPVFDPDGGPVTVTYVSGELPPGITMNPDGTFSGVAEEVGTYQVVVQVCDDDDPQICIIHTHTIAVTPVTLPGPEDPPGDDDESPPDVLPFTGGDFGELFIAALLMLGAGAGMVAYSRRRREF